MSKKDSRSDNGNRSGKKRKERRDSTSSYGRNSEGGSRSHEKKSKKKSNRRDSEGGGGRVSHGERSERVGGKFNKDNKQRASSYSPRKGNAENKVASDDVNAFVRLNNEILSFCRTVMPTSSQMQLREAVAQEITDIAIKLWPGCEVHLFGSLYTGTAILHSDIDVTLLGVAYEEDGPLDAEGKATEKVEVGRTELLISLADKIKELDIASYLEVIATAKVPIIKMDHRATGLSLDICINEASGLVTGRVIAQVQKDFPMLKYLVTVLKYFLLQRELHETYRGGVGSFILCTMVASFLQQRLRVHRTLSIQSWNLGSLLLDFFSLYGVTFDYNRTAITFADGGKYIQKRTLPQRDQRPNVISIVDPSPHGDGQIIGHGSFMMPRIKRSFQYALEKLTVQLGANDSSRPLLSHILDLDGVALMVEETTEREAKAAQELDRPYQGPSDEEDEAPAATAAAAAEVGLEVVNLSTEQEIQDEEEGERNHEDDEDEVEDENKDDDDDDDDGGGGGGDDDDDDGENNEERRQRDDPKGEDGKEGENDAPALKRARYATGAAVRELIDLRSDDDSEGPDQGALERWADNTSDEL